MKINIFAASNNHVEMKTRLILAAVLIILISSSCGQRKRGDKTAVKGDPFPKEMVEFVPYENNPVFTGTGQDTWDRTIRERGFILNENGTYKLWYTGYNGPDTVTKYLGYATSPDGINWTRPNLESFKYNGNMNNNIMTDAIPRGVVTVVDDSLYNQTDSTRRYKSVYNTHTTSTNSRLNVSFSYDGLLWIPYEGNPVSHGGEDLSSSGWNPVIGKYLGYFRDSLGIRKVGRYISNDWINWTYTGTILKPESYDIKGTQFYNMTVLFKDSVYWGIAGVLKLILISLKFSESDAKL